MLLLRLSRRRVYAEWKRSDVLMRVETGHGREWGGWLTYVGFVPSDAAGMQTGRRRERRKERAGSGAAITGIKAGRGTAARNP